MNQLPNCYSLTLERDGKKPRDVVVFHVRVTLSQNQMIANFNLRQNTVEQGSHVPNFVMKTSLIPLHPDDPYSVNDGRVQNRLSHTTTSSNGTHNKRHAAS